MDVRPQAARMGSRVGTRMGTCMGTRTSTAHHDIVPRAVFVPVQDVAVIIKEFIGL